MNDLDRLQKRIELEETLKNYTGDDRVIHAEEKRAEIEELKRTRPAFSAMTGIPMLDACMDGFRRGQLIVVSGPPKHGKTALCQTFTRRFTDQGLRCTWFSYEVGMEEMFEKFPMDKMDFYIPNYLESGNVQWIERKIIESKQKFNTDIVFIDNLDFLRDPEVLKINMNLAAYVGSIVQKLKRIAVEQNVIIFLMSHIRKNNWTGNQLPSVEELRDSGQTAQLADIVLMVMREEAERGSKEIYNKNNAWVGVMANRLNGHTKRIPVALRFSGSKGEIIERVSDDEQHDGEATENWAG